MIEQTCCFTGHRPKKLPFKSNETDERCIRLKEILRNEIKKLIAEKGVNKFISGMAIGTDIICTEIVLDMKKEYDIVLECAIPCRNQNEKWNKKQKERYSNLIHQADIVTCLQEDYTRGCMQKRNKYMVDNSQYVIAVWDGSKSGTFNTLKYARKLKRNIMVIDTKIL